MSSLLETIYKKGLAGLREGHEPIPREQAPAAKKPAPDTHEQRLAKESQAWKTGNEVRSKGITEAVVYGFLEDYNGPNVNKYTDWVSRKSSETGESMERVAGKSLRRMNRGIGKFEKANMDAAPAERQDYDDHSYYRGADTPKTPEAGAKVASLRAGFRAIGDDNKNLHSQIKLDKDLTPTERMTPEYL